MRKNEWIAQRIKALPSTQRKFAKAVGIGPPRVVELIKGTRGLKAHEVTRAADFLRMPVTVLLEKLTGELPASGFDPEELELITAYRMLSDERKADVVVMINSWLPERAARLEPPSLHRAKRRQPQGARPMLR